MSTHYGRPSISGCIPAFMALSAMFACQTSTLRAAAVVYEGFDYSAGALGSANGGTGWNTAWSSNGTTNVVATNLTYGSLSTTGGSIGNLSGGQNRPVGYRQVDFSSNPSLLTNDLWFSVIIGYDGGGNRTNSTLQFVLGNAQMSGANYNYSYNNAGESGLGVMLTGYKMQGIYVQDATTQGGTAPTSVTVGVKNDLLFPGADSATPDYALVVGHIAWDVSGTQDRLDIYLPGTDLAQPTVWSTLTVDIVDQSGFNTLSVKRGDKMIMDEIRFGSSYADVLPVPEPASVGLLGLAAGFGLLRRRR